MKRFLFLFLLTYGTLVQAQMPSAILNNYAGTCPVWVIIHSHDNGNFDCTQYTSQPISVHPGEVKIYDMYPGGMNNTITWAPVQPVGDPVWGEIDFYDYYPSNPCPGVQSTDHNFVHCFTGPNAQITVSAQLGTCAQCPQGTIIYAKAAAIYPSFIISFQ